MAGTSDHAEELLNNEWHKQGACLLRHTDNQTDKCKYPKNCRKWTIDNRAQFYQRQEFKDDGYKKVRHLRKSEKSLTRTDKKTDEEQIHTRDTTPTKPTPGKDDPNFWDIGGAAVGRRMNFKPSGPAHYPYRHQWHHIIPSATLYNYLLVTQSALVNIQLHFVLMKGEYNLNHGRNVVLLPEEAQVGRLVKFPTHPNNHPEFDVFAKKKLGRQKRELQNALDQAGGDVHKVDPNVAAGIAETIHSISDDIFDEIEAFGRLKPGRELNEIGKFVDEIAKLLNPGR
jgi:hypothetical protein